MKRTMWLALILLLSLVLALAAAHASGHGKAQAEKRGILLVAFGSSYPEAQASFENVDGRVKAAFPDVPVRWAYTSHIIRHKMAAGGKELLSPAQALAAMADEGFTHVAVQSLHTIPGAEYHDLLTVTAGFRHMADGIPHIAVGMPLLGSSADLVRVADAILATQPRGRKPGEALVLMGHGTHHPANACYPALMWALQQRDENVFVGTVEGFPELDDLVPGLRKQGVTRVWLVPFMSVAGDHARNDMAGTEDDSWRSQLTKAGFSCEVVLKGTAESDAFVDIWLDHLREAYEAL